VSGIGEFCTMDCRRHDFVQRLSPSTQSSPQTPPPPPARRCETRAWTSRGDKAAIARGDRLLGIDYMGRLARRHQPTTGFLQIRRSCQKAKFVAFGMTRSAGRRAAKIRGSPPSCRQGAQVAWWARPEGLPYRRGAGSSTALKTREIYDSLATRRRGWTK